MPLIRLQQNIEKHGASPTQENILFFQTMAWQRLDRFMLAYAGLLFFLAGVICFFAYNWHMLPPFAKFGVMAAALLISAAFPLFHGTHSTSGRLCLLSCGILGGMLMAIHGQVYQTGANSWTLFMSWAIPCAVRMPDRIMVPLLAGFLIIRHPILSGTCYCLA